MNTYSLQIEDVSCIIWMHRPGEMQKIHSQVFQMFNEHFIRDAQTMCDALNQFAARASQPLFTDATINEQKN